MTRHDPLIETARAAKERDTARGTGPRRNTPKSFHDTEALDAEPDEKDTLSVAHSPPNNLREVLEEVAEDLMDDAQRPATLGNIAYALRRIARKLEKGS
jgi:hypothetical protein